MRPLSLNNLVILCHSISTLSMIFCSIYKNCLRFWKSWIMRCMWPKVFNIYSILGRVWGRVRGCQPRHKWVWGGCVTLSWKMLNQKALTKRFSFVVHMNTWVYTYWKILMSLRVHLKSVRSSPWLVWLLFNMQPSREADYCEDYYYLYVLT